MESETLKVKSIEAESIVVKSADGPGEVTIASTKGATLVFVKSKNGSAVSLTCDSQGQAFISAWSSTNDTLPQLSIVPSKDGAYLQVSDGNLSKIFVVKLSDLAKIAKVAVVAGKE